MVGFGFLVFWCFVVGGLWLGWVGIGGFGLGFTWVWVGVGGFDFVVFVLFDICFFSFVFGVFVWCLVVFLDRF